MDSFDSTLEEFEDDFGAAAPSDGELRELLALARTSGNVPLCRLVHSYRTLRRATSDAVAFLEERDGASAVDAVGVLKLAKFLTRGAHT